MSCVLILTPVVVASWPLLSQLVMSVVSNMGFSNVKEEVGEEIEQAVELEVKNTQAITDALKRERKLVLKRGDTIVTFGKDIRGKCKVTVKGENKSREELKKLGEEIAQKIVQQYMYNKIKDELGRKNFRVVEEKVSSDETIRVTVRRWD